MLYLHEKLLCHVTLHSKTNFNLLLLQLPSEWELLVAGWGRNSSDHKDVGDFRRIGAHANIMQKLVVPIVPIEECKSNFKFFRNIHSVRHLCAGGEIGNLNFFSPIHMIAKCESIFKDD